MNLLLNLNQSNNDKTMLSGVSPPLNSMLLPILKYYLPSPLPIKVKVFLTKKLVTKILLETPTYPGIECMFYSKSHPCQKKLLDLIKEVLLWFRNYSLGKTPENLLPLKHFIDSKDQLLAEEISKIPFGLTLSSEVLTKNISIDLTYINICKWISKNPYPLVIPTHRIILNPPKTQKVNRMRQISNKLLKFELSLD